VNVFLIAGPPGIGKSTQSRSFVPEGVAIIDQDLAAYQYKRKGFSDYRDIASLTTNERIRKSLIAGEDFALELNLGFESHYAFLQSIAGFSREINVLLTLFFTDDIQICLHRAEIRFQNGGHEVKPEVIREMYDDSLPLLAQHREMFADITLVDVTYEGVTELTSKQEELPEWVKAFDLQKYLV
jgi:predicted ABC-type ATPase